MLDPACSKSPCTTGEERYILDFVWKTVQNLAIHDHILVCPIYNHDDLKVVSCEPNDNKMLVIMSYSYIEDGAAVRYD